jgi:hypothetical protein
VDALNDMEHYTLDTGHVRQVLTGIELAWLTRGLENAIKRSWQWTGSHFQGHVD